MPNYGKYDGLNYKDRLKVRHADYLARNFHKSDGFDLVGLKKPNIVLEEDVPIIMYATKSDGQRNFMCHPDYKVERGDIIHYVDGHQYLVTEGQTHFEVNNFGKAWRMTESISWKDSVGNTLTHYFYSPKGSSGTQDTDLSLPLVVGSREMVLQFNDETKNIYENQRFILGNQRAYKIVSYDNYTYSGLLRLGYQRDVLDERDDLANNIAYNGEIETPQPTPTTEIRFSVDSLEIPVGLSETITVNEYIAGVVQPTTFTFRIDGIDPSKYQILSTTPNSIEILCKSFYHTGQLVAIKDVTLEETSIPLILKSLF